MSDRHHRRSFVAALSTGIAVGLTGCIGGDSNEGDDAMSDGMDDGSMSDGMDGNSSMDDGTSGDPEGQTSITYEFSTLPELASGTYEGWAIFGDEKVSTGKFNVGDDYTFENSRDLSAADKIVVTVEPPNDGSDAPSGIVVLKGALDGSEASLSFPADFGGAEGSYILATPSAETSDTPTSGIWFLDPSGDGGPQASLSLPELPNGWVYEGWAVTEGTKLSTGRFSTPDEDVSFDEYNGPGKTPPFPGQDFLQNAPEGIDFPVSLDDGNSKAVITAEPDMDGMDPTGAAPSGIKPLVGMIPGDAEPKTSYDLQQALDSVPSGTATLK